MKKPRNGIKRACKNVSSSRFLFSLDSYIVLIIFSNVIALLLWKNCAVDDFYSYTCKNRDQITTNNKSGQCDV